jgi:hypothetical protein
MGVILNGTNANISIGDKATLKPIAFGIAVWFEFNSTRTGGYRGIFSNAKNTSPYGGFKLAVQESNGDMHIYFRTANNAWAGCLNSGWAKDKLHLIGATYDGTTTRLYMNSAQVKSTPMSGNALYNTTPLKMGSDGDNQNYLCGKLYQALFFNRAITAAEMLTIYYSSGHDGIIDGLIGRWNFDEKHPGATSHGESGFVKDCSLNKNGGDTANITYTSTPLSFRKRR